MTISVKVVGQDKAIRIEDAGPAVLLMDAPGFDVDPSAPVVIPIRDNLSGWPTNWLRIPATNRTWYFNLQQVQFYYTEEEVTPQCEDS